MSSTPSPVGGRISVVVVNDRTPGPTVGCLEALRDLDRDDVEVRVANASGDDSVDVLRVMPDGSCLFGRARRRLRRRDRA